jgi:hypothetical protein
MRHPLPRTVFLANTEGKITIPKAGAEWEVLAVNEIDDEVSATPALSDGRSTCAGARCTASAPRSRPQRSCRRTFAHNYESQSYENCELHPHEIKTI